MPIRKGGAIKRMIDGEEILLKHPHKFARWTFIIGRTGKAIYRDTAVNASKDGQKAIEFIRGMK